MESFKSTSEPTSRIGQLEENLNQTQSNKSDPQSYQSQYQQSFHKFNQPNSQQQFQQNYQYYPNAQISNNFGNNAYLDNDYQSPEKQMVNQNIYNQNDANFQQPQQQNQQLNPQMNFQKAQPQNKFYQKNQQNQQNNLNHHNANFYQQQYEFQQNAQQIFPKFNQFQDDSPSNSQTFNQKPILQINNNSQINFVSNGSNNNNNRKVNSNNQQDKKLISSLDIEMGNLLQKNEKEQHKYFDSKQNQDDENQIKDQEIAKSPKMSLQYEKINQQRFEINYEETFQNIQKEKEIPNIYPCLGINKLGESYQSEFFTKVSKYLGNQGFLHYRGVRGDGNCYWRSVAFQYLERLVLKNKMKEIQNLLYWVQIQKSYYNISNFKSKAYETKDIKEYLEIGLISLIKCLENSKVNDLIERFQAVQRLFLVKEFDYAIIYLFRVITANFMLKNQDRSINQLPIIIAPIVDSQDYSLEQYIEEIVLKMGVDAQGFLFQIVPIALRVNIYIVNIDTSAAARKKMEQHLGSAINIQECKSVYEDIGFKMNDMLNFHNEILFVLRKDGHYDIIYGTQSDEIWKDFNFNELYESDMEFNEAFKKQEKKIVKQKEKEKAEKFEKNQNKQKMSKQEQEEHKEEVQLQMINKSKQMLRKQSFQLLQIKEVQQNQCYTCWKAIERHEELVQLECSCQYHINCLYSQTKTMQNPQCPNKFLFNNCQNKEQALISKERLQEITKIYNDLNNIQVQPVIKKQNSQNNQKNKQSSNQQINQQQIKQQNKEQLSDAPYSKLIDAEENKKVTVVNQQNNFQVDTGCIRFGKYFVIFLLVIGFAYVAYIAFIQYIGSQS